MEPAYVKLYKNLREAIASGIWQYGAKFPSKRTLSDETGLSVITVAHAIELLCDEGWLLAKERSGLYVAYREEPVLTEPVDFEPDPPAGAAPLPFPTYARALRAVLNTHGARLMERSPNRGHPDLIEALCAYLQTRRNMKVSPDQIIIGSGAEYLYGLVAHLFGRDGSFALEDPSYNLIRRVYELHGVRTELLPMDRDGIRSDALRASSAAILHVTPYHSWPSSVTIGASKRREYITWAQKNHAFLVEDDFDSELSSSSKPEEPLFSMAPDRVIHLNTFTRTLSPALRVGYMVLPESLLPLWHEKAFFLTCTVPVTEQMVIAELLRTGEFTRHLNRVRRERRRSP